MRLQLHRNLEDPEGVNPGQSDATLPLGVPKQKLSTWLSTSQVVRELPGSLGLLVCR
jgi:hypothetical protein